MATQTALQAVPVPLAQRPADVSPLIWLGALAALDPGELPDYLAYLEEVRSGKAVQWYPEAAPYVLASDNPEEE